jgi:putative hydrolase of the HAD superfamily
VTKLSAPSLAANWAEKDAWVFDLDNTLYPAECDLFAQIDVKMTDFVARHLQLERGAALKLQKQYLVEHGTTLNGLMREHGLPPRAFLDYVHDIDLSPLSAAPLLAEHLAALPGRRLVYTNGSRGHGERVLDKLGLTHLFEDIFDIEASEYTPKPLAASYERFMARHRFDPKRAVFFEDTARNLKPAADMGFTTVLVHSAKDWSHEPPETRPAGAGEAPAHVHHTTDDLPGFLAGLFRR